MNILRQHWFDLGLGLAVVVGGGLLVLRPGLVASLLWLSLITLFLHQFEEYRYPGYFPGMVNTAMYASAQPDRYPLNMQIALIVNVFIGWPTYTLAALLAERALWLGIAAMLVSAGNLVAHTFLFNHKGQTRYNPGMLTALVLFAPLVVIFFAVVVRGGLATGLDWGLGLSLGAALNYLGVVKLIEVLKDPATPYVFPARCLPPRLRARR